jgi:hypothetical protein
VDWIHEKSAPSERGFLTARRGAERGKLKLGSRVIAGDDPQGLRTKKKEKKHEKANDRGSGLDRWFRNG